MSFNPIRNRSCRVFCLAGMRVSPALPVRARSTLAWRRLFRGLSLSFHGREKVVSWTDAALERQSDGGQDTDAGCEDRISAGIDPRRCEMDLCWPVGVH
jgi:hypothetical protein